MLLKVMAACLLTIFSTCAAGSISARYNEKGRLLAGLAESLLRMKSAIGFSAKSIHEIIKDLAKGEEGWRMFYKTLEQYLSSDKEAPLSKAFAKARNEFSTEYQFKEEDLQPVALLGDSIEQSDITYICNAIQAAADNLAAKSKEYIGYYKSKAKVYNSIGLIIGLFSSILLL